MRATLFVLIFTLIMTAYFQINVVSACNSQTSDSTTKASTTTRAARILNEETGLLNQIKSKGNEHHKKEQKLLVA